MDASGSTDVTALLLAWSDGETAALDDLLPLVYAELHRLAEHQFRSERADHTLQCTALVHETFLRLIDQRRVRWKSRTHFYGIASRLMRRILVDHARGRGAVKRGSGLRVALDEALDEAAHRDVDLLALDEAMSRLEAVDPRQSRIVELRFFGGLTIDETAEVVSLSPATVKREWTAARAWLFGQVMGEAPDA